MEPARPLHLHEEGLSGLSLAPVPFPQNMPEKLRIDA
jgi:hypothetical protein